MVRNVGFSGSGITTPPNRNNSFGIARVLAASGVIFSHHFALSGLVEPNLYGITIGAVSVMLFFLMSGFLIFSSLQRNADIFRFCSARVLRILPNLVFVLFTTSFLTMVYYANIENWPSHVRYVVQNVAMLLRGGPMYDVNGIWNQRPYPALNGSIWSLPYEVWCYILLFLVIHFTGNYRRFHLYFSVFLCLALILIPTTRLFPLAMSTGKFGALGIWFFLGALVASYGKGLPIISSPLLSRFEKTGDPSYGMYIIAWPIQQICIIEIQDFWVSMAASFGISVSLAYLTWHSFEKRALLQVGVLAEWLRRMWKSSLVLVRIR
jgi:peptidoglycan/LPS O-acetylase OafA/YrhL